MDLNTDTRVGRMLDGLIRTENRRAKLVLAVDITGARAHHQDFRVKAWTGRDGTRMLTFDLADGDYTAGTYSTKVLHVNTTTGVASPARGYSDPLVLYMAQAALQYACTGSAPSPRNGTVRVQEAEHCGCCGLQLTHPVSIELGIGPECSKRMGLEHHYGGSTKAATRKQKKAAATPADAPARDVDGLLAEWEELYEDVLGQMVAAARSAARAQARTALEAGNEPPSIVVRADTPRSVVAEQLGTEALDILDTHAGLEAALGVPAGTTPAAAASDDGALCTGCERHVYTAAAPTCPYCFPAAADDSATYEATTSAAIIALQRLEQRLLKQYNEANAACAFELAQALADDLDECRGQRSGLQAELRAAVAAR